MTRDKMKRSKHLSIVDVILLERRSRLHMHDVTSDKQRRPVRMPTRRRRRESPHCGHVDAKRACSSADGAWFSTNHMVRILRPGDFQTSELLYPNILRW